MNKTFENKNLEIIHSFSLWKEFEYVLNENSSNFLPYHNLNHILSVMEASYTLINAYIAAGEKFTEQQIRNLLIAALFHDFKHSGGKLNDTDNVKKAIDCFRKFVALNNNKYYKYYTVENITEVENIIQMTTYPYIKPIDEIGLRGKIIRDADLAQSARADFFISMVGLMYEHKAELKTVVKNTIQFNKDNPFHLELSEKYFGEQRKQNIQDLELFSNKL